MAGLLKGAVGRAQDKTHQHPAAGDLQKQLSAEPTKRLNCDLPKSLHRQFKAKSGEEGRSMSQIVTELVTEYLSK